MPNEWEGWTFRLRYVRCGKANCGTCAATEGHGPYWYGYQHRNGKVRSRYFGARPTSTFTATQVEPPADQRWYFTGNMNWTTALRIMGFQQKPNEQTLHARWRSLVLEHHPDYGGDTKICAAINAAYTYLKS